MNAQAIATPEQVSDILVAAFEGGSNYWVAQVDIDGPWPKLPPGDRFASHVPGAGGRLIVHELVDERHGETTAHTLDLATMQKGIAAAAVLRGLTIERFYDEHDASDADIALQLAILGEVRYG